MLALLPLGAGCQNSPPEDGASPPANAAARSPAGSPPDSTIAAPSDSARDRSAEPPPAVGDRAPSTAPASASSTAGGPYLAVSRSASSAVPDALGSGRFSIRDDCVVWELEGAADRFTPVFPTGTQLVRTADGSPSALRIGGVTARFGRTYRVSGGEVPAAAAPDGALRSPIPARCPARRFMFGRVREAP
ncbi:MAG TPA: hypothetical protein VFZ91_09095 [Allosphingosinicella sp.]